MFLDEIDKRELLSDDSDLSGKLISLNFYINDNNLYLGFDVSDRYFKFKNLNDVLEKMLTDNRISLSLAFDCDLHNLNITGDK